MPQNSPVQLTAEAPPEQLAAERAEAPIPTAAGAPRNGADPDEPTRALRATPPGPRAPGHVISHELTAPLVEAPPSPFPPIPGYALDKYVGKGGMGVVYRARHHATGRLVALKLISPRSATDETARERFVREIHALAAIKHPNIVPMYDAGEWHGFPFCTMEYAEGGTLNDHLDRIRADRDRAVALIVKVVRAVEYLHTRTPGIIHRDLKPMNILLGANDEPMVADFGLAKWVDKESDLTLSEGPVGTRLYMAPEQTLGRKQNYTPSCDVWALGVTLYEVLTGRRPFHTDGGTSTYHFIRTAEPAPMTDLSPDLPEALQAVVLKCLAKRPEDRYQSAAALADDLDRWLRREPVLAAPPAPTVAPAAEIAEPSPAAPEIRRPKRWKQVAVLALATALVALGAGALLPRKSIEQRLAAEKPVRLTDDKGRPLVEPVDEPELGLLRDKRGEYHTFSRNGTGITNFIDIPLPEEYCVEADVAVEFKPATGSRVGIYAGRKSWPGLPVKFESMAVASVAPRMNPQTDKPEVWGELRLYSWPKHNLGNGTNFTGNFTSWDRVSKDGEFRFTHVRLEVHKDFIQATIDEVPFKPMPFEMVGKLLNCDIADRREQDKFSFPEYTFETPFLGRGIGILCANSTCVVRNMTVTKLAPNP